MATALFQSHTPPSPSTLSKSDSDGSRLSVDGKSSDGLDTPLTSPESFPVKRYERRLGDSELSYFLPSRADGVNDMYLHLGLRTTAERMDRTRVRTVWAILRQRHPLLASEVEFHDYDDVRFVYTPAASVEDCISDADANLEYRTQGKDELIDAYLNGPRTLSSNRLSYLIVSRPSAPRSAPADDAPHEERESLQDFEILLCATHYLGDGMALHTCANDFFTILGGPLTQEALIQILSDEAPPRWDTPIHNAATLPVPLEDKLPQTHGKFQQVAAKLTFKAEQRRSFGGHVFKRKGGKTRHTIVPTVSFDAVRTQSMLKKCKANGVSISAAIFALCNIAWARVKDSKDDLPMMMYSALNMRPYCGETNGHASYWFLAVGYFNVVLPSFLSKSSKAEKIFWHRARAAKEQSSRAAKSPLVAVHAREMASERAARARAWGKEDDEKERGVWVPPPPKPEAARSEQPIVPSVALIGLSLLGNLDGMYKHVSYPDVQLHTLTTGSRQRPGGMLLFGYTFASKLWISLGYDENGFDEVQIARFWNTLTLAVDEFLG
ncbi:hypothetical protein PUNSTDRAFT_95410 [Punctularia strigosozonata HHB-11173 SS5]|uniref:uncharacterized protein n=1 Tax=Punctularia strigosozonata (strain HHB-11173) TaxID=741275 RepID=UPI0004416CE5|nr:uncharacterized protein PUNSTDRAFT_95410 [Punctularia strigosozonata HHB-11173 SS5]EIN13965.1 hypothetical protein PUNSTDRAFT_95410 [Punctularia strigosozonata HHB-11173 SS5]